ncbi:xanthine dehydrogenase family protein molybdopterin-binding subunit [Tardiphaga robiniae]|uniref:Xanthine dehydrogenase family protein molybdopterin-binding subunit n=1 Tax=Tardiphaga robiniae TaxID=943830 RepID=A0A7G6U0B9_9BRAD|nr:xanthine dehydrogenase family protein molybdopterin-binding subunit [Tardiphaga robiniae]QND72451.1 xanthine dehydrogenase family protein molybdopterin-binding subunit [Tardiphaga robiniae]
MSDVAKLLVGSAVERMEDARFLSGSGNFADDLAVEGMLHAAILRSPIAHARIVAIDASAALAMPGIHAVITARDISDAIPIIPLRLAPLPEFEPFRQPVIASDKVRYVGEPIAVVIAGSRALAEDALETIGIEFEALSAVTERGASETPLFDFAEDNVALRYDAGFGDADAAFASADYVRTERFSVQRHTALPMETRGLLAEWNSSAGRLVVTGATKVTFYNRRALAQMLGLREDDIDLIEIDVGGGFGVRGEFYPEDFLIPFAARKLARPVKWIEDRREHLMAINHSRDIACELSLACRSDGMMLGLRGRVFADMGAYIRTNGGVVPAKAAQFLPGPYRIPHVSVSVEAFMTNKTPVGTYRGPGRFEANFFRERLIDMAAMDLGIDIAEFRRKNLITEQELPYPIDGLVPYEGPTSYDTGDYVGVFERALKEIGWREKRHLQGKLVDGVRHGIGLGCFVESGGAGPKENAALTLEKDGSLTIAVGSSVLGQGLETVLGQIASDTLSVPFDRIRVLHGSTTLLDEGFGTYHSRAVVMGGSAVLDAATRLREKILQQASNHLGRPNSELKIVNANVIADNGTSVSFATLAAGRELQADGTFSNDVRTYSYGTHAAHVTVDPRTGAVKVLDYIAVEDVGRAINPAIVHGQAIGAIVQGLGGVFLDHLIYDDQGQLLNASLADYLVPTASDFPVLRAVTLELRPSPSNPLGAKGAGEGGIVAVAAATANAVAAALAPLNVEIHHLPLTPPRLWRLIKDARERASNAA